MTGLLLPFRFEAPQLKAQLNNIDAGEWTPHYNERDYGGDWRGVALRSHSGKSSDLITKPPGSSEFVDTPLLERCPYFQTVLSMFDCPLKSVRLLSLAPQSFIREHSDHALDFEDGEVRIHVPVQTSSDIEFYLNGARLLLEEGHSYYLNVNLPHRVNNRSHEERIHLVIDAEVNAWLRELFAANQTPIPTCAPHPKGYEAFREVVLRDRSLQDELRVLETPAEVINTVVKQGEQRGYQFTPADVEATRNRIPLSSASTLHGYLPAKYNAGRLQWVHIGRHRLTEPFFDDTIHQCLRNPYASLFRQNTRLEVLEQLDEPALEPAGFIFHTSRCGSTLVSQMLSSLPRTIVVSEPPVIDDILQSGVDNQVQWLRQIVRALGRRRTGEETHLFIKLDAWLIHKLPVIRAAFPNTPWIFLSRNLDEVVASQLRSPGLHCAPGAMPDPTILQLTREDITGLAREQWCIEVLKKIQKSALKYREEPYGLYVDYADLPGAVWTAIAPHFNLKLSKEDMDAMCVITTRHAKTGEPWTGRG